MRLLSGRIHLFLRIGFPVLRLKRLFILYGALGFEKPCQSLLLYADDPQRLKDALERP